MSFSSLLEDFRNRGSEGRNGSFHLIPAQGESLGTCILLHGFAHRARHLRFFAEALSASGRDALLFDYCSFRSGIDSLGMDFLACFRELLEERASAERFDFVTHSMGGLVLRTAMNAMSENELNRIKRIVMLAPPNRGSFWGSLALLLGLKRVLPALTDMATLPSAFVHGIPPPRVSVPLGIIRAERDWKVHAASVAPRGIPFASTEVDAGHNGILKSQEAVSAVVRFLNAGSFQPYAPSKS